jgi:putative DNA primase/helicase
VLGAFFVRESLAAGQKGTALAAVYPENIPSELKAVDHWVLWRIETRDDKPTKPPWRVDGVSHASATDPQTWSSFDRAYQAYLSGDWDGIGVVMTEDMGLVGVDLDKIDSWLPEADGILAALDSYSEITPSQNGYRVYVRGEMPPGARRKGHVEIYNHARFFTVTGDSIGRDTVIEERSEQLAAVHAKWLGRTTARPFGGLASITTGRGAAPEPTKLSQSDSDLLVRAGQTSSHFADLWMGMGSGNHSSDDLALANYLAFWWGPDPWAIDNMFRHSGLMRDKWDSARGESTYGAWTIARALEGRTEFYEGAGVAPTDLRANRGAAVPKPPAPKIGGTADADNARRLVARHGPSIRYSATLGKWLTWDGTRWLADDLFKVMALAEETIRSLATEAADPETDHDKARALSRHMAASLSAGRLKAMVELAKSQPGVAIAADEMDADPWLLNCINGTVDLRTGRLRPHDPLDLITKLAPVDFDPDAACPRWVAMLSRVMGGNQRLTQFLWRAAGYSLTGSMKERVMFVLVGIGRNGKTTFVETIKAVLGDYAMTAGAETLMLRPDATGGASGDVARLKGARYVASSETAEGRQLDEARVKGITGGDSLTARFLYQESFTFKPSFKIWLATNHRPTVRDNQAIWDRIRQVTFGVRIADDEVDGDLGDKLMTEAPGILAWAVRGCLEWQEHGLEAPPEVMDATAEYRADMDIFQDFLDECCETGTGLDVAARTLYQAYRVWADATGHKPMSQTMMGRKLTERGFKKATEGHSKTNVWQGLGLRVSADAFGALSRKFSNSFSHEDFSGSALNAPALLRNDPPSMLPWESNR